MADHFDQRDSARVALVLALVLTVPIFAPASPAARWLAHPRVSAMTASAIIVVGLAYHVLLSAINNPVDTQVQRSRGACAHGLRVFNLSISVIGCSGDD